MLCLGQIIELVIADLYTVLAVQCGADHISDVDLHCKDFHPLTISTNFRPEPPNKAFYWDGGCILISLLPLQYIRQDIPLQSPKIHLGPTCQRTMRRSSHSLYSNGGSQSRIRLLYSPFTYTCDLASTNPRKSKDWSYVCFLGWVVVSYPV